MTPEKPIRINKSFGVSDIEVFADSALPHIIVKGYASKMLDASGRLAIDSDGENISSYGIDLKRMQTGNVPLLFSHSQEAAIGKVLTADYRPEGLEITAKIFKLPNDDTSNYVFEAVKAGVLNSFSVGILVKAFDMVEQDGEDYLQLSESELVEVSIVSVPALNLATFGILETKSVDESSSYKTLISKSVLKTENPNACKDFEQCSIKGKDEMIVKDVTPEVKEETPTEAPTEAPTVEPEVIKEEVPEIKEEPIIEEVLEVKEEVLIEPKERTIDDLITDNALMGSKVADMTLEDLEKVYNSISQLSESIADFVTTQIKDEGNAQRANTEA